MKVIPKFLRRCLTILADVKASDGSAMTSGQRDGWFCKQLMERQLPPVVASAMVADALDADDPQGYMNKLDLQLKAYRANQASVLAAVTEADAVTDAVAGIRMTKRQNGAKKPGGAGKEGGKEGKCFYHYRFGDRAQRCDGDGCKDKNKPLAKKTT